MIGLDYSGIILANVLAFLLAKNVPRLAILFSGPVGREFTNICSILATLSQANSAMRVASSACQIALVTLA